MIGPSAIKNNGLNNFPRVWLKLTRSMTKYLNIKVQLFLDITLFQGNVFLDMSSCVFTIETFRYHFFYTQVLRSEVSHDILL